jgi:plasmid stabilization system protein ParE
MRYVFHPEAQSELQSAVDYYEECREGLGDEFALEVNSAIQRILAFPQAWTRLSGQIRRCIVNRFPYGVIYQNFNGEILILALMPLRRKPGYWKKRLR